MLDLDSGEVLRTVELGEVPPWPIRLVGSLLAIGPESAGPMIDGAASGELVLLDLSDPGASPLRLEDVTGMIEPARPPTMSHMPALAATDGSGAGLIVLQDHGTELTLTHFDGSGQEVRQETRTVDDPACCWQAFPGDTPGRYVVVAPHRREGEVRSTDTGEVLSTFDVPPSVDADDWQLWFGPIVWNQGPSGLMVIGPSGRYETTGRAEPVAFAPVPVVAVDGALVALDVEKLVDG